MPLKPHRACNYPGCPSIARDTYCEYHQQLVNQKYEVNRETATQRGYGTRWRRLRTMIIARDPICRVCKAKPSTDVDHIKPKSKGGTDNPDNLQGLCHECHSRKTAKEDGRWGTTVNEPLNAR